MDKKEASGLFFLQGLVDLDKEARLKTKGDFLQ
jgi:hypothetical protein